MSEINSTFAWKVCMALAVLIVYIVKVGLREHRCIIGLSLTTGDWELGELCGIVDIHNEKQYSVQIQTCTLILKIIVWKEIIKNINLGLIQEYGVLIINQ